MALKTSKFFISPSSDWISRLLFFHVLLFFGRVTVDAQVIEVFLETPNVQRTSGCRRGLKPGYDNVRFPGYVEGMPPDNQARFETRKSDSDPWRQLCAIDLNVCNNDEGEICNCYPSDQMNTRIVRLVMAAIPLLQGSHIRLVAGAHHSRFRRMPEIFQTGVETLNSRNGNITVFNDTHCDIGLPTTGTTYIEYCVRRLVGKYKVKVVFAGRRPWKLETDSLPCIGTQIQLSSARPTVGTAARVTLGNKLSLSFSEENCNTKKEKTCTISEFTSVVVYLDPFNRRDSSTVCEVEGMLEEEFFYFKGMVNTKGVNTELRKPVFEVQIGKPGGLYKTVGSIKNAPCGPNAEPNQAYCLEKIRDVYDIRINLTATPVMREKSIRLVWPKTSEDEFDSSQSQAIPTIHKRFTTTLQANNGEKIKLSEGPAPWDLKMPRFKNSVLKFCINNPADSYRVSASIDGSTVKSAFSQPCITINHTPSCYDFQKTFGFMYAETENCYRTGIYENKGLVPYLEANQTVLDPESQDCFFQWHQGPSEAVIKFCTFNLATPYMLTASIQGHEFNSTINSCLTIRTIPLPGKLEFKAETGCLIEPSYVCTVQLIGESAIEAQISADHETFSVTNESCNIVLHHRHNTSMLFCIYDLKTPYMVSMTLYGTGVEENMLVKTEDCVSFYYKANYETTDIFSIQDTENTSRVYRCSVTFYPDTDVPSHVDLGLPLLYSASGILFLISGYACMWFCCLTIRKRKRTPNPENEDYQDDGYDIFSRDVNSEEPQELQNRRISLETSSYSSEGTSVDTSASSTDESEKSNTKRRRRSFPYSISS